MPRLNYTGRKKIHHRDVLITIFDNDGIRKFDADIDLSPYDLPSEAPVFVEAYRQYAWMRFEYGQVSHIKAQTDNRLSEFDSVDGLLFRVKVTQSDGARGKLLAAAERVRPVKPDEENSKKLGLLPVRSVDMNSVWRLQITDHPVLEISKRAGSKDIISRSPEFLSLVYPSVLREVLHEIRRTDDDWRDDEDSWQNQWVRFVGLLPDLREMPEPPEAEEDDDDFELWVDDAVEAFSSRLGVIDRFVSYNEPKDR